MSFMKKLSLSLFSIVLFLSIITSATSFEKIIIGKANVTDGDTIKINKLNKLRLSFFIKLVHFISNILI